MAIGGIKKVLLADCGLCRKSHQYREGTNTTEAKKELEWLGWEESDKYGLLCEGCKNIAKVPPNPYCDACGGPCYCAEIMAG